MTREFAGIDEILGDRAGRFFAEGFRAARHALGELEIGVRHHHGFIRGRATVHYQRGAKATNTALSSIDALVIAVQLCEIYLATRFGLGPAERSRMWIRQFVVKAENPSPAAAPLSVSAVHLATHFESRSLCGNVSEMSCVVGAVTVRLEIEHEIAELRRTGGYLAAVDQLLGAPTSRYYGERYKHSHQHLERVEIDAAQMTASAMVRLSVADDDRPAMGLQGGYLPAVTYIDAIVVGAELAQALFTVVTEQRGTSVSDLYIRSVSAASKTPHLDVLPFFARARVVRAAPRGDRPGGRRQVDDVLVELQGIKAEFSLSHATARPVPGSDGHTV